MAPRGPPSHGCELPLVVFSTSPLSPLLSSPLLSSRRPRPRHPSTPHPPAAPPSVCPARSLPCRGGSRHGHHAHPTPAASPTAPHPALPTRLPADVISPAPPSRHPFVSMLMLHSIEWRFVSKSAPRRPVVSPLAIHRHFSPVLASKPPFHMQMPVTVTQTPCRIHLTSPISYLGKGGGPLEKCSQEEKLWRASAGFSHEPPMPTLLPL